MDIEPREGLIFEKLRLADAARLRETYDIYRTSFPHPDEQEPFEAFVQILALNDDAEIQRDFGPYQEVALAICVPLTRQIVGGLVIGITSGPEHIASGFAASVQAIYYFLDRPYRKAFAPSRVIAEIRRHALRAFPPPPGLTGEDVAIFFEVNNPLDMTAEDILEDIDNAGLDPFRRYEAWKRFSSPLRFEYVQPSLGGTKSPVHFLHLFYLGKGDAVPGAMLLAHLSRFISISVLKGQDANENREFLGMAAWLRQTARVGFIPSDDNGQLKIHLEANQRRKLAQALERESAVMRPPKMPEGGRRRRIPSPSLVNRVYRLFYRLHHLLERYHVLASWFELGVGSFALLALLFAWAAGLASWMGFEEYQHDAEVIIVLFLAFYILSRGVVRARRSRLGYRFGAMLRQMRAPDGDTGGTTKWLKQELTKTVNRRTAFGPMVRPGTSDGERGDIRQLVSSYASQIYSDQVLGVIDKVWENWEFRQLSGWLDDFPEALIGATYDTCPDRTFFSVIVPILVPGGRLTRLDLRHLRTDRYVARRLLGLRPGLRNGDDAGQGAPTLMVLRLLMSRHEPGHKGGGAFERQMGLVATGLTHLALLLKQLARDGNILVGLPVNTAILIVAVNRQSIQLLDWFGFTLLQRAAPPDETDAGEAPGEANMSVYRFVVRTLGERTIKEQQFLDILATLLECLQRR